VLAEDGAPAPLFWDGIRGINESRVNLNPPGNLPGREYGASRPLRGPVEARRTGDGLRRFPAPAGKDGALGTGRILFRLACRAASAISPAWGLGPRSLVVLARRRGFPLPRMLPVCPYQGMALADQAAR
jgi:hypothetical protein